MKFGPQYERARDEIVERFGQNEGIAFIGVGYKYVGGQRTDEVAVAVGVERKRPEAELSASEIIPRSVSGIRTDVTECGKLIAYELIQRIRPTPGGYSCGHYNISAGTLGCWVRRGTSERLHILSNNHVLADSNDASIGDSIYQPGPYDGGTAADRIATLTEYVRIRYDGASDGKKRKSAAALFWRVSKAVPNALARLVGCPYRLVVVQPQQIPQPYPNLVDAAVATAVNDADANCEIAQIGPIIGIRDLRLGDVVQKVGRTTERLSAPVEVVGAVARVSYGSKGDATFADQHIVRGNFSEPGDSGSAVLTSDNYLGGLLFAGGTGVTIVNRIAHVIALLGVRL